MPASYVLVDHDGESLASSAGELITAARVFGPVTAVVVGEPGTAKRLQPQLAGEGAEQILAAEAEGVTKRLILPEVDAVSVLAAAEPAPILVSASDRGKEIAGRLAARLASGVLSDVVAVNADRTAKQSIFGDEIDIDAAVGGESPVYALRPGAVEAAPQPAAGEIEEVALPEPGEKDVEVRAFAPTERGDRPELTQANVVVAGGRGVGSRENFESVLEPLADALGGAVGATRDAVELGYYDARYQIGQTGVTVSPDLYIGVGISGAVQHTVGMKTAKTIVAVNIDQDAPLFEIADLSVVGDLHEVVPKLLEAIAQRRGA